MSAPFKTPSEWRRHRLFRLSASGWSAVIEQHDHHPARSCIEDWAEHDRPLVVTRQDPPSATTLWFGLPAPTSWHRQRLGGQAERSEIIGIDDFPALNAAAALLPCASQAQWLELSERMAGMGRVGRVYGSYGWQLLTGLGYVRESSDLDLLITVDSAQSADAVAALLERAGKGLPRIDGELEFADGSAVAWREWRNWRAGRAREILVKRIDGVALERNSGWLPAIVADA